jgi:uncharacterized protein
VPRLIGSEYSTYQLTIARSPIQGRGVFALEAIPRGKKIIEYTGERLTPLQALRRARRNVRLGAARKNVYFAGLSRRWLLDGGVGGTGAELINQSCDPNISARRIRGRIFYFSRRPIRKGEELTVDYRYPKNSTKKRCKCGARNCRGRLS